MASVLVMKNEAGKLQGFGRRGERAYNRFLGEVKKLEIGEMIEFSYWAPRSPKFHRLHFQMLRVVFDAQDVFDDDYGFRKWSEVGAGHADFVRGAKGELVALPRSISYESLDDVAFGEVHSAVKSFFRGEHARRFLWAHLADQMSWDMVEQLLAGFEVER